MIDFTFKESQSTRHCTSKNEYQAVISSLAYHTIILFNCNKISLCNIENYKSGFAGGILNKTHYVFKFKILTDEKGTISVTLY